MSREIPNPAGNLSPGDRKQIRGLLKSKTSEGVTLGLSLLDSLGATAADYEAVFTDRVIKTVLKTWDEAIWAAVFRAMLPYEALFGRFRRWVKKAYAYREERDEWFNGLVFALIPAARVGFLAAWGEAADPKKPFIELVDVPAGSFMMGSPEQEAGRSDDEGQVQVRITKPFRMGRTVITQGQWRAVMGTEPWLEDPSYDWDDDFPAVYVYWDDAVLFCETLTGLERETGRLTASQSYRLPTEAEWEYACRAGTTTAYSFGDDPHLLSEHGWYSDNSDGPQKVAKKKANPWGLFDMHGNVSQWCAGWYSDALHGGDDPQGATAGSARFARGGSWDYVASGCRSASRDSDSALGVYCGFRVVVAS
jgi:formylglycine-generating enzyme required for sulfatase activity